MEPATVNGGLSAHAVVHPGSTSCVHDVPSQAQVSFVPEIPPKRTISPRAGSYAMAAPLRPAGAPVHESVQLGSVESATCVHAEPSQTQVSLRSGPSEGPDPPCPPNRTSWLLAGSYAITLA